MEINPVPFWANLFLYFYESIYDRTYFKQSN